MKKVYRIILSGLFVVVLFIGGCGPSTPPLPTPTVCPTIIQENIGKEPSFYFFLIDGTQNYLNDGNISIAKYIINDSLKSILQSGDRVVLAWINKSLGGINSSIFYYSTFTFIATGFEPTQTPPPFPTSFEDTTATPTATPRSQLGQDAAADEIAEAQTAQAEAVNHFFCTLGEINKTSEEINLEIEKLRLQEASIFSNEIQSAIPLEFEFYGDDALNPSFEAIKMASEFINLQCSDVNYSDCVLIIFSNLTDPRRVKEKIEDPLLISDFVKKTDIVSMLLNCKFVDGECESRINDWSRHFSDFNIKEFYPILNPYEGTQSQNAELSTEFIKTVEIIKSNE